jgi:hypothetical protein
MEATSIPRPSHMPLGGSGWILSILKGESVAPQPAELRAWITVLDVISHATEVVLSDVRRGI